PSISDGRLSYQFSSDGYIRRSVYAYVVSGKTFSGKDWSLTARAGLHYEFDLTDSADVHLKDAAGEHQINGRKDSRMLYGVGLNARFGDNTRLGLEVERSAFGKYNTDDAINANIRYSF
ncbi:autotransporter outer membrane beta-barrel domain-containing protein, partial [Escherichia coli]|uniref:autotransporter outer membrane beta-barrel domain-containing protein n=1 Tax=Escherichia coli TaxID=562 RepID=UPI003CEFEE54